MVKIPNGMTECTGEMSSDDDSDESGEEAAQNEPFQVLTDNKIYFILLFCILLCTTQYKY